MRLVFLIKLEPGFLEKQLALLAKIRAHHGARVTEVAIAQSETK